VTEDPVKLKQELENTKKTLLDLARDLTANATSTSSAATVTFTGSRVEIRAGQKPVRTPLP
jgi:hypothetical protein